MIYPIARTIAAAIVALALAGCAGIPGPNPRDPLEKFNRSMYDLNEHVDSIVLRPAATAYRRGVPPVIRTGVANFFGNLQDAWSFVNSVLQWRIQDAGESFARVQINTIAGLGGVMDVASELNIEKHKEDFGQTLGRWGVPAGPYVVIPFLGPSTMRDALALPIDMKGDLIWRMPRGDERTGLYALRAIDRRANLLRLGEVVDQAALDKYSFTREAYLQKRRADVYDFKKASDDDGAEPKQDAEPAKRNPAAPARSK
ncbi:MAG TPA: VacJ family lipoprotein [Ramlibacter sp.]|nr:VacJ family lipoprotein [Ramlibacter sp.]